MSLNVKTLAIGGNEVTLRLTSKALFNFNQKHGSEGTSPLVALLSAVDDIGARMDLLTNALNHPETKNKIKDGGQLLDFLADDGWDRDMVNILILELAQESGLISNEELSNLSDPVAENGKRLVGKLADLLSGKPMGKDAQEDAEEENPT
jgi:hypothetical protein